jgi:hypothetical protein
MGVLIMGANDLIFTLRESGFSVSTDNSRLQIAPAKNLTNELKQTIQQSKVEILCALHQEDYEEALKHALHDPISALTCFTSLAHKAELI